MPSPVVFRARDSRSAGSSTVTFVVLMPRRYQRRHHSASWCQRGLRTGSRNPRAGPPTCCAIIRGQMPPYEKSQPPLLYPPYQSTRLRAPSQPLIRIPAHYSDLAQPVYGHLPIGPDDNDLTVHGAGGLAAGRAHHRGGPRRGRGRPAGAAHADRDLADQRRRPVPARQGHAPGAARSQLHRRGPHRDRRRGPLHASRRSSPAPIRGATTPTRGVRRTSTSRSSGRRFSRGW